MSHFSSRARKRSVIMIAPSGISPRRRNPEEALACILRKVLTVEIYSQYARKNLDLLEQGPRGIGR